jgi:hypothetical protein
LARRIEIGTISVCNKAIIAFDNKVKGEQDFHPLAWRLMIDPCSLTGKDEFKTG